MAPRDRVRRSAILCCHFLRNLAYYRAGWARGALRQQVLGYGERKFSRYVRPRVVQGDKKDKHYWQKVVTDVPAFSASLLAHL